MKLTRRDRMMVAVLGVGLLLFAGWWLAIRPAKDEAAAARTELETVRTGLEASRAQLARAADKPVGRAARTARTVRLSRAAPPTAREPEAIIELQRLAVRSGVELSSITTEESADLGGVATGHPLVLGVKGSFFAVDDFLYRLQNQVRTKGPRLVKVTGRLFVVAKAEIVLDEAEDVLTREGDVSATLRLQAISSGSASADAAAAAPTPTATGATTP